MYIAINYKNTKNKKNSTNLVLFVDQKFNISGLKKHISHSEFYFISDLLKTKDLKKKIINFDINSKKKIILVSLKKNLTGSDVENLGAKFYEY